MSKSIQILPGSPLFRAQQVGRGVFRQPLPDPSKQFNGNYDPLYYRQSLTPPLSATPGTGFAYLDTPVLPYYAIQSDPKTDMLGFTFKSHGISFKLRKPLTASGDAYFELSVLTSKNATPVDYRMTKEDVAFALECIRQEMDQNDPRQVAVLAALESHAPTRATLSTPLKTTDRAAYMHKFTFSAYDRTYEVEIAERNDPIFKVIGYPSTSTPLSRSMTKAEVIFAINKIAYELPAKDAPFYGPYIQRMREYSWDMDQPPQVTGTGVNASARSVKLNY